MTPATARRPRATPARLLVVDEHGAVWHRHHRDLPALFDPGDLVIANDAATLPASLTGIHLSTGAAIEVRLAGRGSLAPAAVTRFTAVVFGHGDYHTPTEQRDAPPALHAGDELLVASLHARVLGTLGHPRLIELAFEHPPAEIWEGLARHGRPIQYAYVQQPLAIWDTWTSFAAQPVAYEAPSAGFVLDWSMLHELRRRGVGFATVTHAAGISSTGDPDLDARLPFDEPYFIPPSTVDAIDDAEAHGGRVIAIGTTVVRALEHAARATGYVAAGPGVASGRIGPDTTLRVVDAIVSGMHEPNTSHYDLLRAFQSDAAIMKMSEEAESQHSRGHEFGDAVLMIRSNAQSRMSNAECSMPDAQRAMPNGSLV